MLEGMFRVLKGNREEIISHYKKDEYLRNGYSVIDDFGNVIEQGTKSKHALKENLDAALKRIEELEEENKQLKGEGKPKKDSLSK